MPKLRRGLFQQPGNVSKLPRTESFAHKNDFSGRNEPAGSCKPGSFHSSAARSRKCSQAECYQTRGNAPSGNAQTAAPSSGAGKTCSSSNSSYPSRSSGSPTANQFPERRKRRRNPGKEKEQPWRYHHLAYFRLPRLWHLLLFLR